MTTVGYGDVTPKDVAGRLVAALVMLEGIALIAIVTAAITSTFVSRATHLQAKNLEKEEERTQAGFAISPSASTASRRCSALSASVDALGWVRVPGVGQLE